MRQFNENLADTLRPTKIEEIHGQPMAVNLVTSMVDTDWINRLLLSGVSGCGKSSMGFIIAGLYLCEDQDYVKQHHEKCGKCNSCKAWRGGSPPEHPRLIFIEATGQGGKEDAAAIRDVMGSAGGRRVLIIDECAELTTAAQTLLQVPLETSMVRQGKNGLMLIICTAYPEKLKKDFRHRLTPINFRPINKDELLRVAAEMQVQADETALSMIAEQSEGSYRGFLVSLEAIRMASAGNHITETTVAEFFNLVSPSERTQLWSNIIAGRNLTRYFNTWRSRGIDADHLLKGLANDLASLSNAKTIECMGILRPAFSVKPEQKLAMVELSLNCMIPLLHNAEIKAPEPEFKIFPNVRLINASTPE